MQFLKNVRQLSTIFFLFSRLAPLNWGRSIDSLFVKILQGYVKLQKLVLNKFLLNSKGKNIFIFFGTSIWNIYDLQISIDFYFNGDARLGFGLFKYDIFICGSQSVCL
jgi:hypothetical protein